MNEPVTVVLLGEPVPYARTRTNGNIHFTPKKQRNAAAALRVVAQQEMRGREPLDGPVDFEFLAEFSIPKSWSKKKQAKALTGEIRPTKRPDWDNLGKLASDGLNGVAYRDDAIIVDARIRKIYGVQPKIVVTVSECVP